MVNKKAKFNYNILEEYTTGIILIGSEVKSVRLGHVSMDESYCYFKDGELYIKNLYIKPYEHSLDGLNSTRDRKLLLKKSELSKLKSTISEKGLTIVPLVLKVGARVKVIIGVGKGKKLYDKRETIKERDIKKQLARYERV